MFYNSFPFFLSSLPFSPGQPQTCSSKYVAEGVLKLVILLQVPLEYWDSRCISSALICCLS